MSVYDLFTLVLHLLTLIKTRVVWIPVYICNPLVCTREYPGGLGGGHHIEIYIIFKRKKKTQKEENLYKF